MHKHPQRQGLAVMGEKVPRRLITRPPALLSKTCSFGRSNGNVNDERQVTTHYSTGHIRMSGFLEGLR